VTISEDMSKPSEELKRAVQEYFIPGEFALCICHSKTPVFKNPPPGYTSICDNNACGKTFAQLEAHYTPVVQDIFDKEVEAVKDAASISPSTFPIEAVKKITNKTSVMSMFQKYVHPAFEALPNEWDNSIHGKDYVELVTKYLVIYEGLTQSKRTDFLNEIRTLNEDDHDEIIENLKNSLKK
jgi:hypothetical protein